MKRWYGDGRRQALFILLLARELEEEGGINLPDSETSHEDRGDERDGCDYAEDLELCFSEAGQVVREINVATDALVGRKESGDLR